MDKAGRLVLPKSLRDQVGLTPGEVEVVADGAGLRIEPSFRSDIVVVAGYLTLPEADAPVTSDQIRELRLADQR
jgi:bifunctional DNA-binding transcriptional regulator/antitoxin component of YhaV-PrlF toxin-antitoxin module